jgi:hypothetical protein
MAMDTELDMAMDMGKRARSTAMVSITSTPNYPRNLRTHLINTLMTKKTHKSIEKSTSR